jgi:hypothetical protein
MDPVTAFLNFATVLLKVVEKAMDGQSPEQKAKMWEWFIADVSWWRNKLNIEKEA